MNRKTRMGFKLAIERIYLSFRNYFMRHPVKVYITSSVICFIVLAIVQIMLVYNTYDLLNRRFYYEKKGRINERYTKAIINDHIFPGGKDIIESLLSPQYHALETLYKAGDTVRFNHASQLLLRNIFQTLINKQNADALLRDIKFKEGIRDSLKYLLVVSRIDLQFAEPKYVNIYDKRNKYPLIDADIQTSKGIRIFGDLSNPDEQSQIIGLFVSDPKPYTYAISFSLYADPANRRQVVFKQMQGILAMSLLSVLAIIILFFITLRNWIKQKHIADVKTDFINNITHEFHTPLSAIMVANKNIQNERVLENKTAIRSLSDIIERQSQRLKLLIGQVLDIATVDQLYVQKSPEDLNVLISEILTDFSIKFPSDNLQLSFVPAPSTIIVDTDSFHFTTLLLNLLDNAVKYNLQEVKQIQVAVVVIDTDIQISISDNGIGMDKETIRYIFDKFYRNQKDLTQNAKGLGLGLHYVKQCIDAHQWAVRVESEPGMGSTFVIIIPK
ncbi:sensor histidine kinase [Chitinophaga sancti]|uniref:histidine kinase n=2 Tax=Chitinophaga sancti TaxID=1004 RepID=A0ABZ0XAY1_9BACT|nr:HAMP domain-containing sensor histidine kinase [Chitinophaga sancti]WQD60100.1 HAMP domain-containing sensor histidine kinase [Chitinophaga sancti]WQG87772.1 HAMP domain-containing sensor histidine kinase [Chitinophaga sancti]